MPRQPKRNVDEIFDLIKDINFFNDQGQVLRLADSVWKHAESILKGQMTAKYLYLYISQNRNKILERFREKYDINMEDSKLSESLNSTDISRESNDSNWSTSSLRHLKPWRTILYLDFDTWSKIYDIHDSVTKLKSGWTDLIYHEIWTQLKIPCCYSFKFGKINSTPGEIFLKIRGKCTECGALFNAYSMQKPNADTKMEIHCSTYDTRGIVHKKSDNCAN